uniref:BTB domain-containing protein n=1 Tax=Panagrolaimus sp. ES5 TaxID=591445 RepID=A0AC34FV10_9BILA
MLSVEYSDDPGEIKAETKITEYRPLESVTSILDQALTTKELADVIFRTNDSQKVYTNRCILYSQSDILKALFHEKPETPTEIEVNFSKNIVLRALKFCYGKNDIIENFESELKNFADKYGIKELKAICLKSLELRILTCENICDIVSLAFIHEHDILK